ncbi:MAG TPA: cation/multidrug efflux pump [Gammaproteobacteria bacterium]|nr:cation/multidrug efflux pump [Gammaproteobacteria bacterium]HET7587565.1 cation/multidrug efflux pump [Gammaproteobacteria bacterium]
MGGLGTSGWLYLAVIVIAAFALMVVLSGLMRFRRRQIVRGSVQTLSGCCVGLIAAVVLLIGLNLLTWQRFTHERPVAELSFSQLGPQHFAVDMHFPDGREQRITLHGDEWQLDARILKWKSLATLLGFDPLYRIERIHGRYDDLRQAQTTPPSVVGLSEPRGISLWNIAHDKAGWLPFVDASYGSATYLPMIDGARYRVSISNTGLLARPLNDAASQAVRRW